MKFQNVLYNTYIVYLNSHYNKRSNTSCSNIWRAIVHRKGAKLTRYPLSRPCIMARLSLAPGLPLILCFHLTAAGDSPPFRPVFHLSISLLAAAPPIGALRPLVPLSSSGELRNCLVVRGSRVRLCATLWRSCACAVARHRSRTQ